MSLDASSRPRCHRKIRPSAPRPDSVSSRRTSGSRRSRGAAGVPGHCWCWCFSSSAGPAAGEESRLFLKFLARGEAREPHSQLGEVFLLVTRQRPAACCCPGQPALAPPTARQLTSRGRDSSRPPSRSCLEVQSDRASPELVGETPPPPLLPLRRLHATTRLNAQGSVEEAQSNGGSIYPSKGLTCHEQG